MNNKKKGTAFEKTMQEIYSQNGWWVHFISPDSRGMQPFDVIAVKNNKIHVFDCKTCQSDIFSIDRLEDNQILAFEKWIKCGNSDPFIAVEHDSKVYFIDYKRLKKEKRINLSREVGTLWLTRDVR